MLDRSIIAASGAFVALSIWGLFIPDGGGLPLVPQIVISISVVFMLFGHMYKHLGLKLSLAFGATAAVIEWGFEQTNISFGGFIWGDIRYGDTAVLGPLIGDVPVVVPLMMAAILWPTYACVNLLLDGRLVVDPR